MCTTTVHFILWDSMAQVAPSDAFCGCGGREGKATGAQRSRRPSTTSARYCPPLHSPARVVRLVELLCSRRVLCPIAGVLACKIQLADALHQLPFIPHKEAAKRNLSNSEVGAAKGSKQWGTEQPAESIKKSSEKKNSKY